MPAASAAKVAESGRPASEARGVKLLRDENGAAVFEIESGEYLFVSREFRKK